MRTGQKSFNSGASSGTGEATALARARTGAGVPLAAHRTGRIGALAAEIERGGGRAIAITTDGGEEKQARAFVRGTHQRLGRVGALANDAGVMRLGAIGASTAEERRPRCTRHTGPSVPARRRALGEAPARARRVGEQDGGLVIEDDCDAEYRYDRQPVGALQGLAPELTVYPGMTSKTLAPGLRLGWLVAPKRIHDDLERIKRNDDLHSSVLDQLIVADILESGLRPPRPGHARPLPIWSSSSSPRAGGVLKQLGCRDGWSAGCEAVLAPPVSSQRQRYALRARGAASPRTRNLR